MKLHLAWTAHARQGLLEAVSYIALDNPDAAAAIIERVDAALDRACQFPKSGRRIPELPKDAARELAVPPLRVFYEADTKQLRVLGLKRGEQQFDPNWLQ